MLYQSRSSLLIFCGIIISILFSIPSFGYAEVTCPPNGTESPNHPGCCYTGASTGGMCNVTACDDRACPSNEEIYGHFVSQDPILSSKEGDLMIDPVSGQITIAQKNVQDGDNGVIDDDLSSFSVSPNNSGGVIDDDLTSFFGTILNPIKDFFVQIANNVRVFSNRTNLSHVRINKGSVFEKDAYRSDKEKSASGETSGVIDDDLSSFDVSCPGTGTESPNNPGWCYTGASSDGGCVVVNCDDQVIGLGSTWRIENDSQTDSQFTRTETTKNPSIISKETTSFRYGNTHCPISISSTTSLTSTQKSQIRTCLNDPSLMISESEKNALLQVINR